MTSLKSWFTLVEIIIVVTIIGILISALTPTYIWYVSRWRDTARISNIDQLLKAHNNYFVDKDEYPSAVLGCVNDSSIQVYNDWKSTYDPLSNHNNGCDTNGRYWYASWKLVFNPNIYSLLAIMEQPRGWNYNSSLQDITWTLTTTSYTNITTLISKWAGKYYIRLP